ncbi:MAG: Gmad2 immunoglobulin-like domain-containing protein [Balneolaceae bacterium]|nr:Gmad2 immunoglobulin-like domain-containing protein [Balneolaceae bacterium]
MLKRFCLLFAIVNLILIGCDNSETSSDRSSSNTDSVQTDTSNPWGESYSNAKYDVSLRMPDDWILLEENNLKPAMGTFAINLLKPGTGAEQETPLHVHTEAQHSYVAIWPHGYGTELPASQYAKLDTLTNTPDFQFEVNHEKSKALVLKDGSVWAYNIVPENPPANWEKHGFIFAQISSTNNSATCYDEQSGEEIPLKQCDFLQGDRYVREADLNGQEAQTVRNILESISLDDVETKKQAADLIEIEKPLPNMDVTSPLTIKGKARGPWYFEGSFRVELVDAEGNKLAEKQAQAQGEWMTKDFVPFEVTLEFNAPDDERGQLIFHRANPSGLEKNAMKYTQPVIFPPK